MGRSFLARSFLAGLFWQVFFGRFWGLGCFGCSVGSSAADLGLLLLTGTRKPAKTDLAKQDLANQTCKKDLPKKTLSKKTAPRACGYG